jgi:hypothetical protein
LGDNRCNRRSLAISAREHPFDRARRYAMRVLSDHALLHEQAIFRTQCVNHYQPDKWGQLPGLSELPKDKVPWEVWPGPLILIPPQGDRDQFGTVFESREDRWLVSTSS